MSSVLALTDVFSLLLRFTKFEDWSSITENPEMQFGVSMKKVVKLANEE